MAEIVRYVNTASTGGNGTTNDESGANAAYASLSAWEAAEQTDLDAAGNWMHVYCTTGSGTAADTTALLLATWTTSANSYILIEAASGDEAVKTGWDATRYRLDVTDNDAVELREDFVRFKGLQLRTTYSSTDYRYCIVLDTIDATNEIRVYNCRLENDAPDNNHGGIYATDIDSVLKVWNTIIANCSYMGIRTNATTTAIYNCVIYGVGAGSAYGLYEGGSGTYDVINSAIFNHGDDIYGTWNSIDHCASDDGDGTNDVAETGGGASWTGDFTDAANGNFTLLTGSNLKNAGAADPSSGLYTTDIEGDAYTVAGYSLGVDEFVAAGGNAPTGALYGPLGGPLAGPI